VFANGIQRCLEFDVEGARSNATPVHWAENLHITSASARLSRSPSVVYRGVGGGRSFVSG
jgi:hypothetical protein